MTTEHTQGRWDYESHSMGQVVVVFDENGQTIARMAMLNGSAEANARRIAACVNACDGLSDETLEAGFTFAKHADKHAELTAQRDGLLELCKELWPVLKDAKSAIRKINVERERGMGYYHAEVEWLLERHLEIETLMKKIKVLGGEA